MLGVVHDPIGEGFAHQIGVEQDAGNEGTRVLAAQPRQIGPDHGPEQPDLDIADDAVAEAVDQCRLAQGRGGPDQPDTDDDGGDGDQGVFGLNDEDARHRHRLSQKHPVDGGLQQLKDRRRADAGHGCTDQ